MIKTGHNTRINQAALQAESLYNLYQVLVMDYSSRIDTQLDQVHKMYNETLEFLRSESIGGVVINGIFRNLN